MNEMFKLCLWMFIYKAHYTSQNVYMLILTSEHQIGCKFCNWQKKIVNTVMSRLSGLRSAGKFAIRTEFWGNGFFLLYFDSITSEIRVPEPDVKIWEPMYRNNRIPARWSGNNLIGDLFSHPEIIRWSTSLSNRRLNLFEKVWYFPKHTTTTGKTLTFYSHTSSETNKREFTYIISRHYGNVTCWSRDKICSCHVSCDRLCCPVSYKSSWIDRGQVCPLNSNI